MFFLAVFCFLCESSSFIWSVFFSLDVPLIIVCTEIHKAEFAPWQFALCIVAKIKANAASTQTHVCVPPSRCLIIPTPATAARSTSDREAPAARATAQINASNQR